jgi:hypothetical protein
MTDCVPCPFCGCGITMEKIAPEQGLYRVFHNKATKCGIVYPLLIRADNKKEALAKWNRRFNV